MKTSLKLEIHQKISTASVKEKLKKLLRKGKIETRVLIIEPIHGMPKTWIEAAIKEENFHSEIEKEEKIDYFVVQLRRLLSAEEEEEKLKEVNLLKEKSRDALSPSEKALLFIANLRQG